MVARLKAQALQAGGDFAGFLSGFAPGDGFPVVASGLAQEGGIRSGRFPFVEKLQDRFQSSELKDIAVQALPPIGVNGFSSDVRSHGTRQEQGEPCTALQR